METPLAIFPWPETITAFGALVTGISGCLLSYAAVVKARRESFAKADADCVKRLRDARQEAELAAEELHKLRMERLRGEGAP